jgi:carboxymethylenebutenolidase
MVRDTDDSPHRGLDRVRAEIYLAWVDLDPSAPSETIPLMCAALDGAGVRYTLDRITTALHGFAPPGERYDRAASELHWERVHSLLRRNL